METRKDWTTFKKKNSIPDDAVKGVFYGSSLDKCAKVVNAGKDHDAILTAVNEFRTVHKRYSTGLGKDVQKKAKTFLDKVTKSLDSAEKEAFKGALKGGKGSVVNMDKGDDTIDKATRSISDKRKFGDDAPLSRKGQKDEEFDKKGFDGKSTLPSKADFSKAGKEPIILLAHGSPIGKPGSGKVLASKFADKSPDDIVKFLTKSLPHAYHGVVYLDGCYTGAGNSPGNFAKKVYDGLVKKGYYYLQIKGNLGQAATVDGKEFVVPSELDDKYEELKKERDKLEKDLAKERKQYEDAREQIMEKAMALRRKLRKLDKEATEYKQLKGQVEALDKGLDSVVKLEEQNKKLATMKVRFEFVKDTIKKDLQIEALTMTVGPERLPPR